MTIGPPAPPNIRVVHNHKPAHIDFLERLSVRATSWIGSTSSIVFHTLFFITMFSLRWFHVVMSDILLMLTTIVSLEAIYLAIFIQMTVNKQVYSINKEINEIQEDVEEIEEAMEEATEEDQSDSARLQRVEKMLVALTKGSGTNGHKK